MTHSQQIHFPADHPTAAGHFPGNPIIPGALLLDAAVQAIAGEGGGPITVRVAKFFQPVRPGESLRVDWQAAGGAIKFECRSVGDALVAAGSIAVAP